MRTTSRNWPPIADKGKCPSGLFLLKLEGCRRRHRPGTTLTVAILLLIAALFPQPSVSGPTRNGFDLGDALIPVDAVESGGPERDGIPALDKPHWITADNATFMKPGDRVLGIHRDGIARAYPVAILNWHEIVNDHFGDDPVLVTYCPLCGTGMAFLANIKGKPLHFGVSGLLYNSDVLLYDRQTESLWSQLMSRAVSGPLRGQRLEMIPLEHTSWEDWRHRHPATEVLSIDTGYQRDYSRDPYAGYGRSSAVWFGVKNYSARHHPKEPVIGVIIDSSPKAYPFSALAGTDGDVPDELGGRSILIHYDEKHRTGSVHDAVTGDEIPSVIAYWFAWYAFYPETVLFENKP